MSDIPKGIAALTPEQREEMKKKSRETRLANKEAREKAIEAGVSIDTPIKAIRKKCLDCSGGQYSEVEKCTVKDCPLYLFRFGKRPSDFSEFMNMEDDGVERMKPTEADSKELDDLDV